jgi:F420H(2)-dependent quinone reductase
VRKQTHDLAMAATLASLTRGHRVLHRVSGGRLGRRFPGGQQIVWVTTLGRRSGKWRRTPLLSVTDGAGCYVVTGSNGGQDRVPGWVFNMRDHDAGYVEVDGLAWAAGFEEAAGSDRDALYAQLVASFASFAGYERWAGRPIPVFRIRLAEQVSPQRAARPPTPTRRTR